MPQQERLLMAASMRRRQRGFGLMDALVSMVILAVGMLALARMQTRLIAQTTDSQLRLNATRLADELLSTALVDRANATCYTVPAVGACGSAAAKNRTLAWKERVEAELPGGAASAVLSAGVTNPLTVSVTWTGKGTDDTRILKVTTDVSP